MFIYIYDQNIGTCVGVPYIHTYSSITTQNRKIFSYRLSHRYEIFVANVLESGKLCNLNGELGTDKKSVKEEEEHSVRYGENAVRRVETM